MAHKKQQSQLVALAEGNHTSPVLIPYQTDAPVYHWPIATVGTIVVNVLICFYVLTRPEETADAIYAVGMLRYGWWLPWQWVTSNYLHDVMQLFGTMVFLWSFGLIVEGKVTHDEFSGGLRISAEKLYDLQSARNRYARA